MPLMHACRNGIFGVAGRILTLQKNCILTEWEALMVIQVYLESLALGGVKDVFELGNICL